MALTNEQVVDSLIAFYKSRGEDLTYLLEDPIFARLPINDKIDAIKKHAATIHASSPGGLNKVEKAEVYGAGISGAVTGLGMGMAGIAGGMKLLEMAGKPLAAGMAANKAMAFTVGTGLALGMGAAAIVGQAKAKTLAGARQETRHQLNQVMKDPSDINALGVFSVGSIYKREHKLRDALVNRVSDHIGDATKDMNKTWLPEMFKSKHEEYVSPTSLTFPKLH